MNLNTSTKKYIQQLQYLLIICISLILPYWSLWFNIFKPLSIILLFLGLYSNYRALKNIIKNKIFISLSIFIIFTYLSILWTQYTPAYTLEYKLNFERFKYYFVLIPAIYMSTLNLKQIKNIFLAIAISPLGVIIIYYLNSFDITHIYSFLNINKNGNSHLMIHHLINNMFILYGAIYFYIQIFEHLLKKQYIKSTLFLIITIIYFISMFIDPETTARLIILIFFIIILIIPLLYLKKKYSIFIILISIILISLSINHIPRMQNGINDLNRVVKYGEYTGSWGHRLGFAIVGLKIYKENPIIGRGMSDVRVRTIEFATKDSRYFKNDISYHFHNEHINLLVQVGIIGYLLFLLFIYLLFRINIKDSFIKKINYSFIIIFCMLMFGEYYLSIPTTSSFFALFIGLILLYEKKEFSKSIISD